MKNYLFLVILFFSVSFVFNQNLNAQEKRLNSSPQTFRTFFAGFKKAVEKNDIPMIASMMRFPFRYGFDTGDEGVLSKAQFLKQYDAKFKTSLNEIVGETNPMFSGDKNNFTVTSKDATHLNFVKVGNSFKFSAFIVEP